MEPNCRKWRLVSKDCLDALTTEGFKRSSDDSGDLGWSLWLKGASERYSAFKMDRELSRLQREGEGLDPEGEQRQPPIVDAGHRKDHDPAGVGPPLCDGASDVDPDADTQSLASVHTSDVASEDDHGTLAVPARNSVASALRQKDSGDTPLVVFFRCSMLQMLAGDCDSERRA